MPMIGQQLRDKLYPTGYTRTVYNSAELRDLLRYAYKFRSELNAAIDAAQSELATLADTPEEMKRALATLRLG